MTTPHPQTPRRSKRLRRILAAAVLLAAAGYPAWRYFSAPSGGQENSGSTFTVMRGPLEISVLEGGSVEARESQEIKCEVQGETKILTLIDEGHMITQEDIANGLVLIELDSKDLLDRQVSQELEYQNSLAALTNAKEAYDIQLNENESEIKAAELAVRFARMDLEKYLGESLAAEIIAKVDENTAKYRESMALAAEAESLPTEDPSGAGVENAAGTDGTAPAMEQTDETPEENAAAFETAGAKSLVSDAPAEPEPQKIIPGIDMLKEADPSKLGDGEAQQKIRQLENDLVLSEQDVSLATTKLEGTKRLLEKDFVTKTQFESDQNAFNRKIIARQQAETSKNLFLKYEFPKMAQKLVSEYEESLRKLERSQRRCVSKIAQMDAQRRSAEARHLLQTKKRNELIEQLEKCVIRATKTGLVVYGTGESSWRSDPIEEGAMVRERQVLITIPDTSAMAVKVKVHESFVKKIKPGQETHVRVDAYPNIQLDGKVHQIAVLPDAQNRWMNPDLKIYTTTIYVDGQYEWLKPGMSAEAEIIVDRLENVVQIPLQAVSLDGDRQVCYVSTALGAQKREIQTGSYSTAMIEITKGLEPGERVLLRTPDGMQPEKTNGNGAPEGKGNGEKKKKDRAPKEKQGAPEEKAPESGA